MSPARLQNSTRLSTDGADLGPRKVNMTFLGCLTSKTMRQVHIFSLGRTQAHVLWYSRATWRKTCITPSPFRILETWRAFEELVWKTVKKKRKQMLKTFLHHYIVKIFFFATISLSSADRQGLSAPVAHLCLSPIEVTQHGEGGIGAKASLAHSFIHQARKAPCNAPSFEDSLRPSPN